MVHSHLEKSYILLCLFSKNQHLLSFLQIFWPFRSVLVAWIIASIMHGTSNGWELPQDLANWIQSVWCLMEMGYFFYISQWLNVPSHTRCDCDSKQGICDLKFLTVPVLTRTCIIVCTNFCGFIPRYKRKMFRYKTLSDLLLVFRQPHTN